jgi:hypothetical protein
MENIKILSCYKLFQLIRKKLYNYNKNNDIKESEIWDILEPILADMDEKLDIENKSLKFKNIANDIFTSIMELPESNGYGLIKPNHYLIEQVRIPKQNKFSITKFIQIAFSIGIWEAKPDKKIYKKIQYKKTNLNDILTFIDYSNLSKLDELMNKYSLKKIKKIIKDLDTKYIQSKH